MKTQKEGDKKVPKRSCVLLPTTTDEIPLVSELAKLGLTNLNQLKELIQQAEKAATQSYGPKERYPNESPLAVYNAENENALSLLKDYAKAVDEAKRETGYLPLIPDLRSSTWVETGDEVVCYLIVVKGTRELYACEAVVDDMIRVGIPSMFKKPTIDLHLNLCKSEQTEDCLLKDFGEQVTFDLSSQYVLRRDEANYLRQHPEDFQVWLKYCGGVDPELKLNIEMRHALERCITKK